MGLTRNIVIGNLAIAFLLLGVSIWALISVRNKTLEVVQHSSDHVDPDAIHIKVVPDPEPVLPLKVYESQAAIGTEVFVSKDDQGISKQRKIDNDPFNMVPAEKTLSWPLRIPPQSFGYPVSLKDGSQIFTSLPNGYIAFGQLVDGGSDLFKLNSGEYNTTFPESIPPPGTSGTDDILIPTNRMFRIDNSSGKYLISDSASAVGCVGNVSIALSDDETKLYVGFLDSTQSSSLDPKTGDSTRYLPFHHPVGKVQLWERPVGAKTDGWAQVASTVLSNPFGSTITGMNIGQENSFRKVSVKGDEFGSYIRTTVNNSNAKRVVAIGSNFGTNLEDGRIISIFEEATKGDNKYIVTGVLALPMDTQHFSYPFSDSDRNSFGTSFDIRNDVCVASLGSHDSPGDCRVAYFKRNDQGVWGFIEVIANPSSATEFFGTCIRLSPQTDFCIVGSPSIHGNNGENRGHVYTMIRDLPTDKWTVQEKKISNPNSKSQQNFGWFLNTDQDFQFLAVNSIYDTSYADILVPKDPIASTNTVHYTTVVIFSIDQQNKTVLSDSNSTTTTTTITQPVGTNNNNVVDPLFGRNIQFSYKGSKNQEVVSSSPLNQEIYRFSTSSSSSS